MIFKKKKVVSLIKDLLNCPDDFKFEGEVTNGEIVIKLKKKEEKKIEHTMEVKNAAITLEPMLSDKFRVKSIEPGKWTKVY